LSTQVVEREIGGRRLVIETGRMAKQAAGAALVTYGETMVLVAASDAEVREGLDFFPLTVDYREKGYAAGLIFGGRFRKREGAPTEKEILTMRCIDRPVRPLWPDGYTRDILISAIVLSADKDNDPDVVAMIGASAALVVSPLPFQGPTGSVRIGMVGGKLVINPTYAERESGSLDLTVTGRRGSVAMVEAGAKELPEDRMIEAIALAQKVVDEIVEMQNELASKAGVRKAAFAPPERPLVKLLMGKALKKTVEACKVSGKMASAAAVRAVCDGLVAELCESDDPKAPREKDICAAFEEVEREAVRSIILSGSRVDGRKHDEVRPITCEVALLPRAHGSALFTRGETQVLVATTLGSAADKQYSEGLLGEFTDHFMMHYNFPSFCVGEAKPPRGPSRREIGHGALAGRALEPVLPKQEGFPYIIRLVSDVLESNGSSSMATVCGGTLAMMDAGVPITDPVAGVAMGLVKEKNKVCVLTDIVGA
jgi:polyribonucleotide nucleotidyltransferase